MKKTQCLYHPQFWDDVDRQAQYLQQADALGVEFLDRVDEAVNQIRNNPLHFRILHGNTRHTSLEKFKNHVIHYEYREEESQIRFYALFHGSENPLKWRSRKNF